ncbi:MAG: hypothetical protein ABSG16_21490 [Candidatus Acidiferrum sp.]|jgi:hypothetical protein
MGLAAIRDAFLAGLAIGLDAGLAALGRAQAVLFNDVPFAELVKKRMSGSVNQDLICFG